MPKRGAPKQPYTTGYIRFGYELHFVKRAMEDVVRDATRPSVEGAQWQMECGRIGAVRELKDRTAAEVLATEELCQTCVTVAWTYHLQREAGRGVRTGRENGS